MLLIELRKFNETSCGMMSTIIKNTIWCDGILFASRLEVEVWVFDPLMMSTGLSLGSGFGGSARQVILFGRRFVCRNTIFVMVGGRFHRSLIGLMVIGSLC